MRMVITNLAKIPFPILCVLLVIFRLPPLYILPIKSGFLTSHSIARYIILILLVFVIISGIKKNKKIIKDKRLEILIIVYFLTTSLSVILATNIVEFLLNYKNILFALLLFFVAQDILDSKEKIVKLVKIMIIPIIVNIALEFIIYFQPVNVMNFLKNVFYDSFWNMVEMNLLRNRFFTDIPDATMIPFLMFFSLTEKRIIYKLFFWILIALISLFAILSNFRINLLMAIFSILSGFYIFRDKFNFWILKVLFMLVILYMGYRLSFLYMRYNTLDRLLFPQKKEYASLESRKYFWSQSVKMFLSSPIVGVGLGNYYDNLPSQDKLSFSTSQWQNNLKKISSNDPHNIFFTSLAETGLIGLLSLSAMILYFLTSDFFLIMTKTSLLISAVILSFWCLFLYALVNPSFTFSYVSLFWLLRAIVYKERLIIG